MAWMDQTKRQAHPASYGDFSNGTASIKIQGSVAEVKIHRHYESPSPGSRKSITDFSPRARLSMLKHFQKINFSDHPDPIFMTLTYPDEVPIPELAARNNHKKVMARHLERITGKHVPAAWRVEWQDRKSGNQVGHYVPHWHWLIFGHRFIHRDAVNEAWCRTIGHTGYCRTETKRAWRVSVIQMYMAKYISKEAVSCSLVIAANQNRIGRSYGWLRKREIPMHDETARYKLPDEERKALHRLAAESMPYVSDGLEQSFTLFGAYADDARKILSGETLDGPGTTGVH